MTPVVARAVSRAVAGSADHHAVACAMAGPADHTYALALSGPTVSWAATPAVARADFHGSVSSRNDYKDCHGYFCDGGCAARTEDLQYFCDGDRAARMEDRDGNCAARMEDLDEGLAVGAAVVGLDEGLAVGAAVVGFDEELAVQQKWNNYWSGDDGDGRGRRDDFNGRLRQQQQKRNDLQDIDKRAIAVF